MKTKAWLEHDKSIRSYLWSHRAVAWTQSILNLVLLIICLKFGILQALETWFVGQTSNLLSLWFHYFAIVLLASTIMSLPFSLISHTIERHFKLSKQSYSSLIWDKIKALLIGVVIGSIVLCILFFTIQFFGDVWWVVSCTLFMLLSVVLAQLAPVIFIPLFYKLKPLEEGDLKLRLLRLSESFGVKVQDVYHLGMGEKTEKGNAAFVGIGKTKKIIIGDTLYEKFPHDEVEAVFAHELGHQVHNDLWKGIGFGAIGLYIGFFLTNWIAELKLFPVFETTIERPFGLLLFFVAMSFLNFFLGVPQVAFSRWRERMADTFAKEKIGSGEKLASALERLTIQNRGQFYPNALREFWSFSHPAPARRVTYLRG